MRRMTRHQVEGVLEYQPSTIGTGNKRWRLLVSCSILSFVIMLRGEEMRADRLELEGTRVVLIQEGSAAEILVDDGISKENLRVNSIGKKAVYNETYKPYSAPNPGPDVVIVIIDLQNKKVTCRVTAEGVGRWLDGLQWLDNRWILIQGEYVRFIDTEVCTASDRLWALRKEIAPDRRKIAFVYGPSQKRSPERPSYTVGLASIKRSAHAEVWAWHPIFPRHSTESYPDEEWRTSGIKHFFWGQLAWDAASRRLAFFQEIDGKFWLVCLDVEPVLQKKAPIILLRQPFEMINPSYAPVSWDGDVVTVTEGQRYEPEERPKLTWTFRCPPPHP